MVRGYDRISGLDTTTIEDIENLLYETGIRNIDHFDDIDDIDIVSKFNNIAVSGIGTRPESIIPIPSNDDDIIRLLKAHGWNLNFRKIFQFADPHRALTYICEYAFGYESFNNGKRMYLTRAFITQNAKDMEERDRRIRCAYNADRERAIRRIRKEIIDYERSKDFVNSYAPVTKTLLLEGEEIKLTGQKALNESLMLYDSICGPEVYIHEILLRWNIMYKAMRKIFGKDVSVYDIAKARRHRNMKLATLALVRVSWTLHKISSDDRTCGAYSAIMRISGNEYGLKSPIQFYNEYCRLTK